LHSEERVTNNDITRERGVTFPFIGGCFEGRKRGLPNPGRECPGNAGDETALPDKSAVFSAGFRPKGGRVGRDELKESRFAVKWEEIRVWVGGAGRTLGEERIGDPLLYR